MQIEWQFSVELFLVNDHTKRKYKTQLEHLQSRIQVPLENGSVDRERERKCPKKDYYDKNEHHVKPFGFDILARDILSLAYNPFGFLECHNYMQVYQMKCLLKTVYLLSFFSVRRQKKNWKEQTKTLY